MTEQNQRVLLTEEDIAAKLWDMDEVIAEVRSQSDKFLERFFPEAYGLGGLESYTIFCAACGGSINGSSLSAMRCEEEGCEFGSGFDPTRLLLRSMGYLQAISMATALVKIPPKIRNGTYRKYDSFIDESKRRRRYKLTGAAISTERFWWDIIYHEAFGDYEFYSTPLHCFFDVVEEGEYYDSRFARA